METVNNLVSTASNLIWGEGNGANGKKENETMGQEPLSGETGNVEKGEPYDKGNEEEASTPAGIEEPKSASQTEQDLKTTYNTEDLKPTYNTEEPKSASETEDLKTTYNTEEPKTTSETQPTSTPPNSEEPKSTIETEPNPKTTAPMTTSNTTDQKPTSSEETTADPSSAPQNTQKQQGADRPFDEPSSEEHDRIKETKKEAEDAAKVDTSGPGPKSLEEKASETGGMLDAGAGAGGATTGKVEKSSKAAGDNDDGPQKESHGEGTGEKYVKSSGMKADGGDFDAAKPGAAREADRLLEEKGVHHEVGATSSPVGKEDVGADAKADKPKLSERIKAKLHIHGKDKD